MDHEQETLLSTWFKTYVLGFADGNGTLPPMLELKREHSLRVSADAADISCDLRYNNGDLRTARTLGLFHDIGRFSQYAGYQTFRDDRSINHGHRGAEVMEACPALAACATSDHNRIIAGIRHHNRMHLPDGLDSDILEYVKIVRDADKLDIFQVLFNAWKNRDLWHSPDISLNVDLNGPINPQALDEIRRKRTISAFNMTSLADFFLLQLSWIYHINFRPTHERLLQRSVIEHIAEVLPSTAEIKEQISIARQHAKKQLTKSNI